MVTVQIIDLVNLIQFVVVKNLYKILPEYIEIDLIRIVSDVYYKGPLGIKEVDLFVQ